MIHHHTEIQNTQTSVYHYDIILTLAIFMMCKACVVKY